MYHTPAWETVMGLEVHVELSTKTKIFCGCTTAFGGEPNTHCCPICIGMPGVLPSLNKAVVEYATKAGLALNCEITRYNKFDRKNYFYPDLPKAYQISQLYLPICRNGGVEIEAEGGGRKVIGIHEIHMEEDAGKLVHDPATNATMVDYNRCGVPLIEIVSEPDFRSANEVIRYLEKLKAILQYIGVSDCKMQEGSLRADINLSVRPAGSEAFGTRTEMKNMNSFKAIGRAIAGESARQIHLLEHGGAVTQETRRWDDDKNESFAMRSKEDAQDYKYFPEPDLIPIEISEEVIEQTRRSLPELPEAKRRRYVSELGLSEYDAEQITASKVLVALFEQNLAAGCPAKELANWIMGEVMHLLSESGKEPEDIPFDYGSLGALIGMVEKNEITRSTAKKVFKAVFEENCDPVEYVEQHNLKTVTDTGAVKTVIEEVIAANQKSVEEYKSGKEKALQYLIGQSMRALRGKADPQTVTAILKELLG
ncbi:MAG: Asp-tRNA(Asn)/Glu-tRNA(Gln) amidotransferase subunit GatB [Clostridia bacterium]|nr:Asp-tRNA(Asn)/Glu-tRNA(Gln) amidotransferase subunit GatB [Clostridia bacterium]